MRKATWMLVLALPLLGFLSATVAGADEHNKKTVLTFSQAVEVPGHVLPAGTAIQMTPAEPVAKVVAVAGTSSAAAAGASVTQAAPRARNRRQLPQTFSDLPLLIVFGLGCIGIAFGLRKVVTRARPPVR